MKPHEEVFESTGKMTGFLRDKRIEVAKEAAATRLRIMGDTAANRIAVQKTLNIDLLKIDTDFHAQSLANEVSYFESTGKIRQGYLDLQKDEYKRAMETMVEQGIPQKLAEEQYKEMVAALWDKLLNPMQDAWQKYYEATGKMSEQHLGIETRNLMRRYEYMKRVLDDELAARKWLEEEKINLRIKNLESQETEIDGIRAAWLRLTKDILPLSKIVSDSWVEMANNIGDTFKEVFSDTIKGELKSFEDYMKKILTNIRDAFIDVCYDMLKNWIKTQISMKAASTGSGLFSFFTAGVGAIGSPTTQMTPGSIAAHGGGMIGMQAFPRKQVPMSIFAHAPRLHTGLKRDEFPAILQYGEEVKKRGDTEPEVGDTYNININAVDAKSFSDLAHNNALVLVSTVTKGLKNNPSNRHEMKRMMK